MLSEKHKTVFFIPLIVLAMVFWGGAWTAGKLISPLADANVVVFWRFLLSFLSFIPIILMNRSSLALDLKGLGWIILSALFYTLYNQLFFNGLRSGLAGAGGVLVTTTNPLFTHMLVLLIFRNKLSVRSVLGLILGISGGFFLLKLWTFDLSQVLQGANLLFLLASLTWAFLTLTSQTAQKRVTFLTYTFYLYGTSTAMQFFFALPQGILTVFQHGLFFWINLVYLAVVAMAFASTVYFLASKKLGSQQASSFVFLVPVSALLTSFIVLHEVPQWYTLLGGFLAMVAVYIIVRQKKRRA